MAGYATRSWLVKTSAVQLVIEAMLARMVKAGMYAHIYVNNIFVFPDREAATPLPERIKAFCGRVQAMDERTPRRQCADAAGECAGCTECIEKRFSVTTILGLVHGGKVYIGGDELPAVTISSTSLTEEGVCSAAIQSLDWHHRAQRVMHRLWSITSTLILVAAALVFARIW